jgi:hypothetical protein
MSRALQDAAQLTLELGRAQDTDELIELLLEGLQRHLGIEHSVLMILDESGERLFTVATRGFSPSGVGSEQRVGQGLWGKVAERHMPLRINNFGREMHYARQVRSTAERAGDESLTREIPLPGLVDLQSMLAVPLLVRGALVGVLGAESAAQLAFDEASEHILTLIAGAVARELHGMREPEDESTPLGSAIESPAADTTRHVSYYVADDSVFVDHDYVIKGLPGRILWKLLRERAAGRQIFTNKELRLDPALKLPAIRDNLESRLILLRRRLEEKDTGMRLHKRGRGRFSLEVDAELVLDEHA